MFESVRADYLRALGPGPHGTRRCALRTVANDYGLQALIVYRLGRWLHDASHWTATRRLLAVLWPLYWIFSALVRNAYGIQLEGSADIGPGLRIHHFGGIGLRACRLGADCIIHHEVQIVPGAGGGRGPTLGDRVWVGPHARIVGDVRVDSGATVSAGSVVVRDVPGRCLVKGNPARVVQFEYDNTGIP